MTKLISKIVLTSLALINQEYITLKFSIGDKGIVIAEVCNTYTLDVATSIISKENFRNFLERKGEIKVSNQLTGDWHTFDSSSGNIDSIIYKSSTQTTKRIINLSINYSSSVKTFIEECILNSTIILFNETEIHEKLTQHPLSLRGITDQTPDLIMSAVKGNPKAVCFITKKYSTDLDEILQYCALNESSSITYLPRSWDMEDLAKAWEVMISVNKECMSELIKIDYDYLDLLKKKHSPNINKIVINHLETLAKMGYNQLKDYKSSHILKDLIPIMIMLHKEVPEKVIDFMFYVIEQPKYYWEDLFALAATPIGRKYLDIYIDKRGPEKFIAGKTYSYYFSYKSKKESERELIKLYEEMLEYNFNKYKNILGPTSSKLQLIYVEKDIMAIKNISKPDQSKEVVEYVLKKDPSLRKYCVAKYANQILGVDEEAAAKRLAKRLAKDSAITTGKDTVGRKVKEKEPTRKEIMEAVIDSKVSNQAYYDSTQTVDEFYERALHPKKYGGSIKGMKI